MLVDLISVTNQEGLRLDGAFYAPAEGPDSDKGALGPVDAVLLIHGSPGQLLRPRHQVHGRRLERAGIRLSCPEHQRPRHHLVQPAGPGLQRQRLRGPGKHYDRPPGRHRLPRGAGLPSHRALGPQYGSGAGHLLRRPPKTTLGSPPSSRSPRSASPILTTSSPRTPGSFAPTWKPPSG